MIKNRLAEIEIPQEEPFANDKLDRQKCAEIFIDLVKLYQSTGCVIALNGEWGIGKTTFVKMTMKEMENRGFRPLYFNAWENDFVSDPLVAFLSELETLNSGSATMNDVLEKGGRIFLSVISSATKTLLKGKLGIDCDAVSAGIDEYTSILKDDLKEFAEQKESFEEFRSSLSEYVATYSNPDHPVVFFVDELDRCNPTFAVKVLERIKHLFDIPNIVFVLSINKEQFEHAIKGYYGNSEINAQNYLRRFIDVEFNLPKPDAESLCEYLYDYYDFNKNPVWRRNNDFLPIATLFVEHANLDIRTTDKIFVLTRLSLFAFRKGTQVDIMILFLLCYLKIIDTSLYNSILNHEYSVQQLLNKLEDSFPNSLFLKENSYDTKPRLMAFIFADLLYMYNAPLGGDRIEDVFDIEVTDGPQLVCTKLDNDSFFEVCKRQDALRHSIITFSTILEAINMRHTLVGS